MTHLRTHRFSLYVFQLAAIAMYLIQSPLLLLALGSLNALITEGIGKESILGPFLFIFHTLIICCKIFIFVVHKNILTTKISDIWFFTGGIS